MATPSELPESVTADIRAILTAPDVDLTSISAKRVRKALQDQHPALDTKKLKEPIDAITIPLFHEIRAEREAAAAKAAKAAKAKAKAASTSSSSSAAPPVKRKRSSSSPAPLAPSSAPLVSQTNGKVKTPAMTDEEVARMLHEEMNGPTRRRAAAGGKGTPGSASSKGKRVKKSSAYVEDSGDDTGSVGLNGDDDDDGEGAGGVKKAKRKKRSSAGGGGGGGYNKEMQCSQALAELIGVPTCSRPQVVKRIWEHIKANDLQDQTDKRYIFLDQRMKAVFGVDRLHMFTMNKLLSEHLHNAEEVVP